MQKSSEEKLRENTLDIIKHLLKDEVMNLASDICLYDDEEYAGDMPEEIEDIKREVIKAAVSLEEELKKDIEERNLRVDFLNALKKKLVETGNSVFSYYSSANLLFGVLQNKILETRVRAEKDYADIEKDVLIEACVKYIEGAENRFTEMKRKSKVLSCVPLKMTADEYAEHIKRPIKYLIEVLPYSSAKLVCNRLKSDFAPFLGEECGKVYPEYRERINALLEKQLFSLDYEEYQGVLDELQSISEESEDIIYGFNMYYNDINYLLNLLSFAVDADYLIEEDFGIKDIFYSLKKLRDTDERELLSESISEKAEKIIEDLTEKLTDLSNEGRKLVSSVPNKDREKFAESTKVCLTTLRIVYTNHHAELIDAYADEFTEAANEPPCTSEQAEELASEICTYISECRKKVSVPLYRELRRVFLNKLPCMLANGEFMYTIQENISEINDKAKLCALAAVLMDEFSQDKDFPREEMPDNEPKRESLSFSEKI